MESRRARLSVEGCNLILMGTAKLTQQLDVRMSWQIDVVIHFHSTESFTLTYTPPRQYWYNQAMFKELASRVLCCLNEGVVIEQTTEDTAFFAPERKQCRPGMTMDTPFTKERT